MKGDFSRLTHDPAKCYTGVLKQQGRVDLDADWNEQVAIIQYHERTKTADLLGGSGAPLDGGGFNVTRLIPEEGKIALSPGRLYVDGILCSLSAETALPYRPGFPNGSREVETLFSPVGMPDEFYTDLVFLDVWERHITSVEDPSLLESALGGADTTTRLQTVWQLRSWRYPGARKETDPFASWPPPPYGRGALTNKTPAGERASDPCKLGPAGGYCGLENLLYRVEIHDEGGLHNATFKWSRDNGSLVFPIDEFFAGQPEKVRVRNIGLDQIAALHIGDSVEVLDDDNDVTGHPGQMATVVDISEDECIVTLDVKISGFDSARHPKLRRWDQTGLAPVTGAYTRLENGIEVKFAGDYFMAGDYWMFSARAETGDLEILAEAPPQGVVHHYCPLALVWWRKEGESWNYGVHDLRPGFPALTDLTGLYYVGGDGQETPFGRELPGPLQVRVAAGGRPMPGSVVHFIAVGNGRLAAAAGGTAQSTTTWLDAKTDSQGLASCFWLPDPALAENEQLMLASLFDMAGRPVHDGQEVRFRARVAPIELQYAGGDGQEAKPGGLLPYPLQVRALSNGFPMKGIKVVFSIADGEGNLAGVSDDSLPAGKPEPGAKGKRRAARLTVLTDETGLAECKWRLDGTLPEQRVEAFLGETDESRRIGFNASFGADFDFTTLHYAGGDGQTARPDGSLAAPLRVWVANAGKPVSGAQVRFKVTQGEGCLAAVAPMPGAKALKDEYLATAGPNGMATCFWRLGSRNPAPQEVTASLAEDGGQTVRTRAEETIRFTTVVADAGTVCYDPPEGCRSFLPELATVHDALDHLMIHAHAPAIRISRIRCGTTELRNDDEVPLDDFAHGIKFEMSQRLAGEAFGGDPCPVCCVTLLMPQMSEGLNISSQSVLIGYTPLMLSASVNVDGPGLYWRPAAPEWLRKIPIVPPVSRIMARIALKGNFIWAESDSTILLDGETFGTPRQGRGRAGAEERTSLALPGGDGHRGGDLDMWVWLVPSGDTAMTLSDLQVVPATVVGGAILTGSLSLKGRGEEGKKYAIELAGHDEVISAIDPSLFELAPGKSAQFAVRTRYRAKAINGCKVSAKLQGTDQQLVVRVNVKPVGMSVQVPGLGGFSGGRVELVEKKSYVVDVNLAEPAPGSLPPVKLVCSEAGAATIDPPEVQVLPNQTVARFNVAVGHVAKDTPGVLRAEITDSLGQKSTAELAVTFKNTAAPARVDLASLTFDPNPAEKDKPIIATLTLNRVTPEPFHVKVNLGEGSPITEVVVQANEEAKKARFTLPVSGTFNVVARGTLDYCRKVTAELVVK